MLMLTLFVSAVLTKFQNDKWNRYASFLCKMWSTTKEVSQQWSIISVHFLWPPVVTELVLNFEE